MPANSGPQTHTQAADARRFPLLRPELATRLSRGEQAFDALPATRCSYRQGEVIVHEGERCQEVFRLRTGWSMRCRRMPDSRRQIIMTFLPSDLFGIKSMLLEKQPDDVQAVTDVSADVVPFDVVQGAMDRNPDLALRLLWQVGEDERRLHNWVVGLGRANATEKIATFLLDLRGRLVVAGLSRGEAFRLPMTQRDIGDHVGLTPVHVNRVLRQLREAGIATIQQGKVALQNVPALRRIAEPALDIFARQAPEFGAATPGGT
jgi:CRP/FNR family transcriptional regulator